MDTERLILLREEKELLKKEMASILGVVESVYSEWENNKLTIPTKRIYELANFFEVNIDYMFKLSDKRVLIKMEKDIDINLVANRIKIIRKELKLTMRSLAKILNTTASAICNYEKGKFLILSPFLIELCRISNYSIDWVLGRSENKYLIK